MRCEPLVSFVVPAYNVEKYIPKTLNSLLSQTCKDFEIIVVDDGSTDNTYNAVKEILEKSGFPNYTILRKPNGGVSFARNVGIRHAKGKYIIFLDGDDYVAPELVEKVKEVVSKNDVDMVCWKFQCVDETGKPTKYQPPLWGLKEGQIYTGLQVLEKILIERSFWIWTASAAYSREKISQDSLFYNEKYHVGEDLEFIYKYLCGCQKIQFIDRVLSYPVWRSGSLTRKPDAKSFDAYLAIMEAQEYLSQKFIDQRDKKLELLKALKRHAVQNFLFWLREQNTRSVWPSYKKITEIIDTRHPGLLDQVKRTAREERISGDIGIEIFKLSPRLYIWLSWIWDRVRRRHSR